LIVFVLCPFVVSTKQDSPLEASNVDKKSSE